MTWFTCFSSGNVPDEASKCVEVLRSVGVGTEASVLCHTETQTDDLLPVELQEGAVGMALDSPLAAEFKTPPKQDRSPTVVRNSDGTSSIPFPPQFYEHTASGSIRSTGRKDGGASGASRQGLRALSSNLPLGHQHPSTAPPRERREFNDSQDLEEALHTVFVQFARFGRSDRSDSQHLDSFRFMKLCRECCLTTDLGDTKCVDLIFYQDNSGSSGQLCAVFQQRPSHPGPGGEAQVVREKGQKDAFKMYSKCTAVSNKHKMTFAKFKVALESIAELLGVDVVDVHKAIANSSGPLLHNVTLPVYTSCQYVSSGQEISAGEGEEAVPDSETPHYLPDPELEEKALYTMDCLPESPGFKILAPGTYPTGLVSASLGSSSGFAPDVHAPRGSPRGGC